MDPDSANLVVFVMLLLIWIIGICARYATVGIKAAALWACIFPLGIGLLEFANYMR